MFNLYDLHQAPELQSEEIVSMTDRVPVYHPTGARNERSLSLAGLAAVLGGAPAEGGGISQETFDAFKANVIADLNNLRDTIMLMQATLDNDAGVATDTWVADGTPPPLVTE